MIAATVAFDLVLVAHIVVAVASVVVLVALRTGATLVARGADLADQRRRFPLRRDWAARVVHLLPVTGLALVATGGASVRLTRPWVLVGLACYLALAGHLEARTLPQERQVARAAASPAGAPPALGRALARSVDVLVSLLALALVAMIVQF